MKSQRIVGFPTQINPHRYTVQNENEPVEVQESDQIQNGNEQLENGDQEQDTASSSRVEVQADVHASSDEQTDEGTTGDYEPDGGESPSNQLTNEAQEAQDQQETEEVKTKEEGASPADDTKGPKIYNLFAISVGWLLTMCACISTRTHQL